MEAALAGRKPRLTVVKTDGTKEPYLHTKVVGTIANALNASEQPDVYAAEELAEAVTFYLYRNENHHKVSSNEILSMIEAVLASTGYEEAAVTLSEYHYQRRLRRSRIEVIKGKLSKLADAENLYKNDAGQTKSRWDKSRIVEDLVAEYELPRNIARAVASIVEERVFSMGLPIVPAILIKQIVLSDTASVVRAQQQMQTV